MLEIRNLRKVFNEGSINEVVAIRSVNCLVQKGDFVTVIGSNGAGKSTLLNLIAGTFLPSGGDIFISGERVTQWPEHRRAAYIGRVFQNPLTGTCASMTVEENFALAGRRGKKPGLRWGVTRQDHKAFQERIRLLGLGLEYRLKDKVGLLSGGQRQSLTLLMATLQKPRLLLLDEHTAALDPPTAEQVLKLTRELILEMGLTSIMVTHNMRHALELGNRLIMMHEGGIILDVAGEEKKRLTVQDLLNEFAKLKGDAVSDDKMLLI
ncbi:ABC transporter ATP-binding protein [Desulforhabdus amnigena]|uniref:ABC transporter ATP-binding protein n=1 Tax=Desulforhabdus amnigena TaxID=40218 RepID=A0A9W6D5Z7_9BACT|nr:ABC transporter ATP-binding protein [Desulforhabdus amnigena]NLJ27194.1 ABC transporter ATP-binding protein [Deltaproteobacteria bacterium]GLI34046.1 ABC transporter ATP-binding protein [Desulforhabdus amnigena]